MKISVKQFVLNGESGYECDRWTGRRGWTDQLLGDDGTFVERGGDLDRGPVCAAQVVEDCRHVDSLGDLEFALGQDPASAGYVEHVPLFVRGRLYGPLGRDEVELALFPGCAEGSPIGLVCQWHGEKRMEG